MMWNGKRKAVTFSYDDGVISDRRLLESLNRYHLKATFNLNSGLLGTDHSWMCGDFAVRRHGKSGLRELYCGHEIAVHGRLHVHPAGLSEDELRDEMLTDKQALETIFGTEIVGMAYSFGEYDENLLRYLKKIGIRYGRTVEATHDFRLPDNPIVWNPTCHHNDPEIFSLVERFLKCDDPQPKLLYIWGHAYEFDADKNWEHFETLCRVLSGHPDIFYGTNREVLGKE